MTSTTIVLTPQYLQSLTPAERKQALGEELYKLIKVWYPTNCGKITGMILEMDNTELLDFLTNTTALQSKCEEANSILHEYNNGSNGAR